MKIRRYWLVQDEQIPEIIELHNAMTAIPLSNVIDWEEVRSDWHEDAPNKLTAVMMPYDTKFIDMPFRQFHNVMKKYRENGRNEARWSRLN